MRAAWPVATVIFDPFFGFDRLMNAVPPLAAFGEAAGELVDDHDLAVADDVLPVEEHLARDLDRARRRTRRSSTAAAGPSPRAWAARGRVAGRRASARSCVRRGRTRKCSSSTNFGSTSAAQR